MLHLTGILHEKNISAKLNTYVHFSTVTKSEKDSSLVHLTFLLESFLDKQSQRASLRLGDEISKVEKKKTDKRLVVHNRISEKENFM